MKCHGGHHRWAINPPTIGTPCTNCDRKWAPRGSHFRNAAPAVVPTPPSPVPVSPELGPAAVVSLPSSDRLAAALTALRARVAPTAPVEAPAPVAPPAPPRGPSRFAQHVGSKLAHIFDAATDAVIESLPGKLRRTPGDADETDLADFEDAAAEIVQRWIPDIDAGPYGKLAVAAVFLVGGKWVDGEPLNRPALAAAPAAATSTTAPPPAPKATPAPPAPPATTPAPLPAVAGGF